MLYVGQQTLARSTYAHFKVDENGQRRTQAGETSFPLKQHACPARRPISLQESQTGYKQSEPTGGAFTNKRTPHTEIQTGFFHSSPSCTRQHARSVQPHLVERALQQCVQPRERRAAVLAGVPATGQYDTCLFSKRLSGLLLSLLPSARDVVPF